MIKLEAIIRPERMEEVKAALDEIGVTGITMTDVRGAGRQRGYVQHYRGAEYHVSLLDKVKIETVLPDDKVEEAVAAIQTAARTGEVGDGKVFLLPVADAIRVRTGERGEQAVS
jgi:nitrogen regulatory protein P-II 1